MINQIACEIRSALSNGLYLSALALSLTLPDACGKAEYPEEKTSVRYKKWCNEHIATVKEEESDECGMPYLSAEMIYSLRNGMLHQNTPNIEVSKMNPTQCKVDKFKLVVNDQGTANGDLSMVSYGEANKVVYREISVYVSHLCNILCDAAEIYYNKNKEKFGFISYTLVDDRTGENYLLSSKVTYPRKEQKNV